MPILTTSKQENYEYESKCKMALIYKAYKTMNENKTKKILILP